MNGFSCDCSKLSMSNWIRCVLPVLLTAAGIFVVAPSRVNGATMYNIVALDVLAGGLDSYATGINELGVVVGHSTLDRSGNVGQSRPVIWDSAGKATALWPDLGPLSVGGIPSGINSAGQ